MKRWQRPKPCWCGGYWFPHRVKGGACIHNPNIPASIRILARRMELTEDETMEFILEMIWDAPGVITKECPF